MGSVRGVGLRAANEDEIDALCETKLRAWSTVVVFTRSALEAAGIEVVPTFRVPHVTLADPSVDALTQKLLLCDHRVVVNPYHDPEIGPTGGSMSGNAVDLELDLNSEDDTGLPWGFVDEADDPSRIREGAWIVVGSGSARQWPKSPTSMERSSMSGPCRVP